MQNQSRSETMTQVQRIEAYQRAIKETLLSEAATPEQRKEGLRLQQNLDALKRMSQSREEPTQGRNLSGSHPTESVDWGYSAPRMKKLETHLIWLQFLNAGLVGLLFASQSAFLQVVAMALIGGTVSVVGYLLALEQIQEFSRNVHDRSEEKSNMTTIAQGPISFEEKYSYSNSAIVAAILLFLNIVAKSLFQLSVLGLTATASHFFGLYLLARLA